MGEVAGEGRTVLFVSHNMGAIGSLCKNVILLTEGDITLRDRPDVVIYHYINKSKKGLRSWLLDAKKLEDDSPIRISGVYLLDLNEKPLRYISTGDGLILRIKYKLEKSRIIPSASFVVRLKNNLGVEVLRLSNTPISGFPINDLRGEGHVDLIIPVFPFTEGMYSLDVALARKNQGFFVNHNDLILLNINGKDIYGGGTFMDQSRGISVIPHKWIHKNKEKETNESSWIGDKLNPRINECEK
jgi:lipopolysaccharide transport system ATP-binding protein